MADPHGEGPSVPIADFLRVSGVRIDQALDHGDPAEAIRLIDVVIEGLRAAAARLVQHRG